MISSLAEEKQSLLRQVQRLSSLNREIEAERNRVKQKVFFFPPFYILSSKQRGGKQLLSI